MAGMRIRLLGRACLFAAGTIACAHPGRINPQARDAPAAAAPVPAPAAVASHGVDFSTRVRPILEARCQPCHFEGGTMYARLPFDRAATVLELREKLFTRIKDEGEQRTIREFLSEHPATGGSRPTGP